MQQQIMPDEFKVQNLSQALQSDNHIQIQEQIIARLKNEIDVAKLSISRLTDMELKARVRAELAENMLETLLEKILNKI